MIHQITTLGEPRYPTPLSRSITEGLSVPYDIIHGRPRFGKEWEFEQAGPREKLFFDPPRTRAGIVTCGGLCPGLNNVIRSLFNELHHACGVQEALGFRGGYLTAVQEATSVLERAHTETQSVHNGIALVKVMGRHSGFIAVGATVASQEVNFCLIPEVPFKLENLLAAVKQRITERAHAVIVVAERAGQEWLGNTGTDRGASGNTKLGDIGPFLRGQLEAHFMAEKIPIVMRYFDPSYHVRSGAANSEDAILCDLFARHAVHAGMAGKTGLVIGFLHDEFIHIPIELLAGRRKSIDPEGPIWSATLAATGQPKPL